MATIKQITFIKTNKYFTLDWVTESVTFEDAKTLCEAISPYSDGNANYYYRIRTRKEVWYPRMLETIIKIAPKYGASVSEYEKLLAEFNAKEEKKRERKHKKMLEELAKRQAEHELYLKRKREQDIAQLIADGAILNTNEGNRLYYVYLDGELEHKSGFDLINTKGLSYDDILKKSQMYYGKATDCRYVKVFIEDMNEIGYIVFHVANWCNPRGMCAGLVVSETEFNSGAFESALIRNCGF